MILALDVATHTGCCWDDEEGRPVFKTINVPAIGGLGYKMKFLLNALWSLEEEIHPRIIAVEEPLPSVARGKRSSPEIDRLLFSLAAIPHYIGACREIPVTERNVVKIKSYWTGNGRADKLAMLRRCKQLHWPTTDDHQADAAALWALVHAQRDPLWDLETLPLFQAKPQHNEP